MNNEELLNKLDNELFLLNDKIDKIYQFINNMELYPQLTTNHKFLLIIQHNAMITYSQILKARIEDLKENNN